MADEEEFRRKIISHVRKRSTGAICFGDMRISGRFPRPDVTIQKKTTTAAANDDGTTKDWKKPPSGRSNATAGDSPLAISPKVGDDNDHSPEYLRAESVDVDDRDLHEADEVNDQAVSSPENVRPAPNRIYQARPIPPPRSSIAICRLRSGRIIEKPIIGGDGEPITYESGDQSSSIADTSKALAAKKRGRPKKDKSLEPLVEEVSYISIADNSRPLVSSTPIRKDHAEIDHGNNDSLKEAIDGDNSRDLFDDSPRQVSASNMDVANIDQQQRSPSSIDTDGSLKQAAAEANEEDDDLNRSDIDLFDGVPNSKIGRESSDLGKNVFDDANLLSEDEDRTEKETGVTNREDAVDETDREVTEGDREENDDTTPIEETYIDPVAINRNFRCSMNAARFSLAVDYEQLVYTACKQPMGPITWRIALSAKTINGCKKIGEGCFGEVFLTKDRKGEPVVLKIIPCEGDCEINGEIPKPFQEVYPEICSTSELSNLRNRRKFATPNFIDIKRIHCVRGAYPKRLLKAWDDYDQKNESDNESPEKFDKTQLFIVFVFANGGMDLEKVKLRSVEQAKSIMKQIGMTLAIAEKELKFEHRDLHVGNVLVSKTKEKEICYIYDGERMIVESQGVHAYVIDFSNSRFNVQLANVPLYTDLGPDEALFEGTGDYQFDIYRMMRDLNNNDWKSFHPKTNVYWIDYLVAYLMTKKRFADNGKTAVMTEEQAKPFAALRKGLTKNYNDCSELIFGHEFFAEFQNA